jgi:hypothetical protein
MRAVEALVCPGRTGKRKPAVPGWHDTLPRVILPAQGW